MKTQEEAYQEIIEGYRMQRIKAANARIPAEFQMPIDRNRSNVDWEAFDDVLSWDGRRSILVKGKSQLGKSRAIYQILYSASVDREKDWIALDEVKVMARVSDAYSEKKLTALTQRWTSVDILFFDDLDKINLSNGVIAQNVMTLVFGVIKSRMAEHKPTFISLNSRVSDVFAPAGPALCESLVERMKQDEHWHVVAFNRGS